MGREDRSTWKANYFTKIIELLDTYQKVFLVTVDNVSSKQMQQIRISLRNRAVLLMGKNTTIRKAIRGHLDQNPQLEKLLPCIKGNVGFVFTNDDLSEIRDMIGENRVQAPAKAGAIAPIEVFVEPGNTGLGPEKTSFFQALHIATKIARGTIEILNRVHLIRYGEKVGASESTLLSMLKIYPFSYGLEIVQVYEDGAVFSPKVLDIKMDDLLTRFVEGVTKIAAVSLQIGYPTVASVPHSIVNGFKRLLAVAVAIDITFPEAEQAKAFVADPSAFVQAVAQTESTDTGGGGAAATEDEKVEEKKEEEEEESDDDMGFGLFD